MRLTRKAVKPEDLILPVIRSTKHMNTDAVIVLEAAVLDPKSEHTGRDVGRLCWISIVAWSLLGVSLAVAACSRTEYLVQWICRRGLRLFYTGHQRSRPLYAAEDTTCARCIAIASPVW